LVTAAVLLTAAVAHAQAGEQVDYRTFFGLSPRTTVWVIAELHLMFAAFVLGVPIFATIAEIVGFRMADREQGERYDALAYEFTKLLSAAFATTAALGGLMTLVLFSTYPTFMRHLTDVFHGTFYIYGLIFFAEAFTLYTYYYGWHRMKTGRKKWGHIGLGVLLNIVGTALMFIANSWATYMMSPPGLEAGAAGQLETHWQGSTYIGPFAEAFNNWLWTPLNVHRLLANVAFGGAICGAYAAVRFLRAKTKEDRAHYDWMGYVGNFIAIMSLLPLPFAGYYLGREIYSFNATMGQDMMGGTFSWTFIIQAVLVGTLFISGNYYLWAGFSRIPGGERYQKFVPWMIGILFFCFAVWLTPHNLPLGGLEKKFGLMPAKNAVIQLMLLTTFGGFLMYRRANKTGPGPNTKSTGARVGVVIASLVGIGILALYTLSGDLSDSNPEVGKYLATDIPVMFMSFQVDPGTTFAATLRGTMWLQIAFVALSAGLFIVGFGRLAQYVLVGVTAVIASGWLFQHGFTIMEQANPLVRQVAVCQVLMILVVFIVAGAMDLFLYRGATSLGPIRWGQMHARSQFSLILLCLLFIINMGLMGFIRSALRKGWHVVGVLKDTSEWSGTPSNLEMAVTVVGISITFIALISFVFWIANLPPKQRHERGATNHA